MKNTFLSQQLLKLSLILSSAFCFQQSTVYAENAFSKSEEKSNTLTWSNSTSPKADNFKPMQKGLKDDNSSLKWLNDDSSISSKGSNIKAGATPPSYHTPGQLLFPLESTETSIKSSDHPTISHNDEKEILSEIKLLAENQSVEQRQTRPQQTAKSSEISSTEEPKTLLINFNNIGIIEYIRFISRVINKNFVFDENDLQFNVTIISEEPTTLDNVMAALLQELRIHDLTLLEQGNNLIIHRNAKVNAISQVVSDDVSKINSNSEIVTQVFKLNTANPEQVASVIKPLTSDFALVEVLAGTNHLIITDLSANILQIGKLIKSIDSPASGLVIGQYVVRTTAPDALIEMARKIISPLSQDQPLTIVSWEASNSIFIVSTSFIVERTLSILQHIDQNEKSTRIFDFKDMQYEKAQNKALSTSGLYLNSESYQPNDEANKLFPVQGQQNNLYPANQWQRTMNGSWLYPLGRDANTNWISPFGKNANGNWNASGENPIGKWTLAKDNHWHFNPNALPDNDQTPQPFGQWIFTSPSGWCYELDQGEAPIIQRLYRRQQEAAPIPLAAKQQSYFSIYKLKYRQGSTIQQALQAIANSLAGGEPGNEDLVATLISVQWLEASNSLIFTGFKDTLNKMQDLMKLVDIPLRQVFIEMLILETTMDDSLEYGVTWGTRFGGANYSGAQAFKTDIDPLNLALNQTGFKEGLGPAVANSLPTQNGLSLGVIGQRIVNTALGLEFNSIGALLHALRTKANTNVILSPKIITEDNVPAEIFVGENVSFKTQSISNANNSNTITNNFEYRDIGTRLRVTPSIGSNNVISLEIAQEISRIIASTIPTGVNANSAPGPSTEKSTTTTRVHLPDGYFLIISGMMRDEANRMSSQVPCLGGIPILGAAFKNKTYNDTKRNQMIFLRPQIIDTEEEVQNLTKHQQDVWDFKKRRKKDWIYETEEAFDWLNLKRDLVESDPNLADRDV